jgi:hypothetical protein
MQICCLTIAPAFVAGGIYLCLRRIVYAFGPANSRITPEAYTRIFIPCDFLSLVLQALGGGMASTASHQKKSVKPGDNIMVAGLSFQVFTLLIFMLVSTDFALRTWRRTKAMGTEAALDPVYAKLRASFAFRGFVGALTLATLCVFIRSVFRVIELSEGWNGSLIKKQKLFIVLEGVMVTIAIVSLMLFNPAFCFREGVEGLGGLGSKRRQNKAMKEMEAEGRGSGSGSVKT